MKPSDYEGKTITVDGHTMEIYDSCNPCYKLWGRNIEFEFRLKIHFWKGKTTLTITKKQKCKLSLYQ